MQQGLSNPTQNLTKIAGTAIQVNAGNTDAGTQRVILATNQSAIPVTGTFWQATQPVSLASLPTLPAGTNNIGDVDVISLPALPAGANTIGAVNQAGTWITRITDGANTASVKAASTAAAATDPALVVAISPNNTVPVSLTTLPTLAAGTNNIGDVDVVSLPGTVAADITAIKTATELFDNAINIHDAVATTSGVQISGFASTTAPTAVVAGDSTRIWTTLNGAVNIADGGASISIDDGGNSITVDGTVAVSGSVAVTGPLTDTQLRATALPISAASLPLPTGAAQETTLSALNTKVPSSLTVKAASTAAAATDPALVVAVSPNNTIPVSLSSVPSHAVTNAGTFAVQVTSAPTTAVTGTFWQATQPVSLATLPALPAGTNNIGDVDVLTLPAITIAASQTIGTVTSLNQFAGAAINLGAGTTGTGTLRVIEASAATGTQTNPSLSTTSATVLAAATTRRGATIFNGSTSILYLRLSATAASTTVYTVKLQPDEYYEVPSYYNGDITGILNTGSTTLVQVTQIT